MTELDYSLKDIATSLTSARNLNSAIKQFLKREVRGKEGARFVKDLKAQIQSKNSKLESFLEKHLPEHEFELMGITRYAYGSEFDAIAVPLMNSYADDFNQSYEIAEAGIKIKDAQRFEDIVGKVQAGIEKGLGEQQLLDTPFIRKVILHWIFNPEVLAKVKEIIDKNQN